VFYIDLISRTLLPDVFEKAALAASVKVTRKKDDQPPTSHTCLLSFFFGAELIAAYLLQSFLRFYKYFIKTVVKNNT